ncbi:NAD(+) diphosphatase [Anaeromicrobium sediminis]|nr:NAD(+) diphosphatase [Anaeromicrobium sediminis]
MDKRRIYFIFNENNEILVNTSNKEILLPSDEHMKNLNISLNNMNLLIEKENEEFLFGKVEDLINLPKDFQFYRLISLIDLMGKEIYNLGSKALHLINWHNDYKYCSKCGTLVEEKKDERAKICPKCGLVNYPTISPAIITAVIKEDKLLLAHNTRFQNDMHSVIAGFVDPGETFEDCVRREVKEEVGIDVKNIKYFGNQPWPFPYSLMVAFTCEYEKGEIKVDGNEIDKANWYSVDNMPNVPSKGSVARELIDWFIENYK